MGLGPFARGGKGEQRPPTPGKGVGLRHGHESAKLPEARSQGRERVCGFWRWGFAPRVQLISGSPRNKDGREHELGVEPFRNAVGEVQPRHGVEIRFEQIGFPNPQRDGLRKIQSTLVPVVDAPAHSDVQTLAVEPIAAERNHVAALPVGIDEGEIRNTLVRGPVQVRVAKVLVRPVVGTPGVVENGRSRNGAVQPTKQAGFGDVCCGCFCA